LRDTPVDDAPDLADDPPDTSFLVTSARGGRDHAMYTIIDRRTVDRERLAETMERAEPDYFSKLRAAPGFVGFYLVPDESTDVFTGITVWESKAHAEKFEPTMSDWLQVLEGLGHHGQSDNRGETVVELQSSR
jgi:hypothetical protein